MDYQTSPLWPETGAGEAKALSHASTPVRRHSRLAGRCEGVFWSRTNRQEVRKIVLAAKRYELAEKTAGSRNGPLGTVAIEVLELFANLVDFRTGRLDPSIDYLMAKLRRSRDAIVRALKALRSHGFLDWLRRYVPTGNDSGPQVQQTSNAYRLSLPARALRLLGRLGQSAPQPDDFSHAQQQRRAELDAHQATLTAEELPFFVVEDEGIAAALSRLAKGMKDRNMREYAKQTESGATKII